MDQAIQCRIFDDCLPWERSYFEIFAGSLAESGNLTFVSDSVATDPALPLWLVSRNWRAALKSVNKRHKGPVFVSLLEAQPADRWLGFFPRYWNPRADLKVCLIAHGNYSSRFFSEMERVPRGNLVDLALPGLMLPLRSPSNTAAPIKVGCLVPPGVEANFNFIVSVAHFVSRAGARVQFMIPSAGSFTAHLEAMARDLGIESLFTRLTGTGEEVDLLLHAPLKAESFLPVLWLGGQGIAVVSTELPGVEAVLSDSRDGFILPVNEVRPMGELIVRLSEDATLRESLGVSLRQGLAKRFALDRIRSQYLTLFQSWKGSNRSPVAAYA